MAPMSSPSPSTIRGISSMATRQLLTELTADFFRASGIVVNFESVGGVDATRRIQAGEVFDLVVLGSDAIDKLMAGGHLQAGSRVDLVHSGVAVAVKAGAPLPELHDEAAVRAAVLAAPSLSYSTGPSGVALAKLFERWGIAEQIAPRMVQAPPGVPVGRLVAQGEVALGFQQLSELLHVPGITIAGPLPPAIQITTVFAAGLPVALSADALQSERVAAFLAYANSPEADAAKHAQGMTPAPTSH